MVSFFETFRVTTAALFISRQRSRGSQAFQVSFTHFVCNIYRLLDYLQCFVFPATIIEVGQTNFFGLSLSLLVSVSSIAVVQTALRILKSIIIERAIPSKMSTFIYRFATIGLSWRQIGQIRHVNIDKCHIFTVHH